MDQTTAISVLGIFAGVMVFFIGASIGSFLNVVVYRLPAGRSIARPRSRCPYCRTPISWYDNLPVLSWLLLRARCRHCGIPIPGRYAAVEAFTGLMTLAFLHRFGPTTLEYVVYGKTGQPVEGVIYFVLACALVAVALIDWDLKIVPDEITLPGIVLGVGASFLLPLAWYDSVLGALVGGGLLFAVAYVYYLITRREGMGMGDVKLLAMMGAFLGWKFVPFSLLFSSVTGSLYGLSLVAFKGRGGRHAFAFGPFLCISGLVYIFWGEAILAMYLGV